MINLRMIVTNDADAATLSASPAAVATLPVSGLQDSSRAKVMRTTGLAAQQINGTWSAARMLSACALMRHNLTSDGTWRLQLFSDAAWATQIYDSGTVISWPAKNLGDLEWGVDSLGATVFNEWGKSFSVLWFAPITALSFRITLTDPANPAGYREAGRLFMGRMIEPMANMSYGLGLGWREDTKQTRTDGGTLRSDQFEPYRRLKFSLGHLDESERPKWLDFVRRVGKRMDFFVSCFPEAGGMKERDYTMSAKIVNTPDSTHPFLNTYAIDFELEEA